MKSSTTDHSPKDSQVSVVLAVYDRPHLLQSTIESVLTQQGIELEFIIVDDGACNAVKTLLQNYISDPRVRIIEQTNRGLTEALINGCEQATSEFIARIDTGDQMCADRLLLQRDLLVSNSRLGLVCSNVELLTEEGHHLSLLEYSNESLHNGLLNSSERDAQSSSPFHASVMFRRSYYQQVGGYRKQFYFAQDLDLWTRMIEVCEIECDQTTLTRGVFSAGGISAQFAPQQRQLKELIVELGNARRQARSENELLAAAQKIRPDVMPVVATQQADDSSDVSEFDGNYFIAKCLYDRQSRHAGMYLNIALSHKPMSLKAWFYYLAWRICGANWDD